MVAVAKRRIVVIGGGGFLEDDERLLQERYLRSLFLSPNPRAVFIGTAAGDAERAQLKFFRAFSQLGFQTRSLPFFPYDPRQDYRAAVCEADLVYVGSGNTPAMLAVWREFRFDSMLREAYESGTVLAGAGAGANCWFEHYVTDSVAGGGLRAGLGWLPGSFCAHLDSQPWRQGMLQDLDGPTVGAGDGVMVLFRNEAWTEAVQDSQDAALCWHRGGADAPLLQVKPRGLER